MPPVYTKPNPISDLVGNIGNSIFPFLGSFLVNTANGLGLFGKETDTTQKGGGTAFPEMKDILNQYAVPEQPPTIKDISPEMSIALQQGKDVAKRYARMTGGMANETPLSVMNAENQGALSGIVSRATSLNAQMEAQRKQSQDAKMAQAVAGLANARNDTTGYNYDPNTIADPGALLQNIFGLGKDPKSGKYTIADFLSGKGLGPIKVGDKTNKKKPGAFGGLV